MFVIGGREAGGRVRRGPTGRGFIPAKPVLDVCYRGAGSRGSFGTKAGVDRIHGELGAHGLSFLPVLPNSRLVRA